MPPSPINLAEKLSLFTEQWSPKIIADYEGFHFKLAKLEGDFVWHSHPESDEAFLVLDGTLRLDFRDGSVVADPRRDEADLLEVLHGHFSDRAQVIVECDGFRQLAIL